MNHHECQCTPELVRKHEEMILMNQKTIEMFMARYTEDRVECAARYARDRQEMREMYGDLLGQMKTVQDFLSELRPNYKTARNIVWLVLIGTIGSVFAYIWGHVTR